MKILQVNCVYPLGSTGKIVHEIHKGLLAHGHESVVCYGRGQKTEHPDIYKTSTEFYSKANNILSRIKGLPYGGCWISTNYLMQIIKKEKPDIVHLHCINNHFVNIYRLIKWLNAQKIKTVITNHAEFFYTANCSHSYECDKWMNGCGKCPRIKKATKSLFFDRTADSYKKMENAFSGFGKNAFVTSVSLWGYERALKSPILKGIPQCVVMNGVDTNVFHPEHNINSNVEKIVLHVTANFDDTVGHSKGGWAVLELARRMQDVPVKFYVAAGSQNIKTEIPTNVVLLGNIKDQVTLAEYYKRADLSIITGKRETFSMPCAESLCCGTPVVGFKAGAPEMISIKEYSEFVEYGDIDSLEKAVRKWLEKTGVDKETIGSQATLTYSNEKMVQSYLKVYGEMI